VCFMCVWCVFGVCLVCVSRKLSVVLCVFRECFVCVWCVFGVCFVCAWCVFGVCLVCVWGYIYRGADVLNQKFCDRIRENANKNVP